MHLTSRRTKWRHNPFQRWPEGVPHDISGFEQPLFSILDNSARQYPDQVYTIFQDGTRTFSQVKETADRVAGFLTSRGHPKGRSGGDFSSESTRIIRLYFSAF